MKLTIEQKLEMIDQVIALCEKSKSSLFTDESDFQKEVVLATKGLQLIFDSLVIETKERMERKKNESNT